MKQSPGSQQQAATQKPQGAGNAGKSAESTLRAQLLAVLSAERTALLNFVALLQREQGMLVENRTTELLKLSEQKSSDAHHLNKLAEARRRFLQGNIPIPAATAATPSTSHSSTGFNKEVIRAWLETHSPDSLTVWNELLTLAERARQLNQTNGELIQMKLRHNQQSLNVLNNAVNKANLYGPDGQPSFSPGTGRSLGSG